MSFKMNVTDVFRLAGGRIVFTGSISDHVGSIGPCKCELRNQDELHQVLNCEGEPFVKKIDPNNKLRSIATTDIVYLTSEEARAGGWTLMCVDV